MICPTCKTNNATSAETCWVCGEKLSKQTKEQVQSFNHTNDFLMGLLVGPVGIICATIIDKRKGFWAAYWGLLVFILAFCFIAMIWVIRFG